MHIGDTPEEAAYRAEARAWLEAHATLKTEAHPGESVDHTRDLAGHERVSAAWRD